VVHEDVDVPYPGKRWLLSLTSLPPGGTRVREQAAETPFFRSLLDPRFKSLERPETFKVRYTAALNAMQVSEKLKVAERQR